MSFVERAAVVECVYVCDCAPAALASPSPPRRGAVVRGGWGGVLGSVEGGLVFGGVRGFHANVGAGSGGCVLGGDTRCPLSVSGRCMCVPSHGSCVTGGCPLQGPHCCLTCPQATTAAYRRTDGGHPGPQWTAGGHRADGQLRTGPLRAVVVPGLSPIWIPLAAVMNGLSISQLCCLFCCPPCPSRIAAKLAFLPPEPTYAVVPEPEPVGSTSTGSLRGGAAGRWKLHLKDRADFQYSQRELDNIEVFVTKSSRGNRVGCMYVRCVPGAR